jgi:hypothetical protein
MLGAIIIDVATLLLTVRVSVKCELHWADRQPQDGDSLVCPIATHALKMYFGAFFFGVSSAGSPSSSPNISRQSSRGVTGVTGANSGVGMIRIPAYVKATRNSDCIVSWEGCRHV